MSDCRGEDIGSTLVTVGSHVACLAQHGQTLAVGLHDPATATLWDARTHQMLMTLDCDARVIGAVCFSPDGCRLVAAGADISGKSRVGDWTIRRDGLP